MNRRASTPIILLFSLSIAWSTYLHAKPDAASQIRKAVKKGHIEQAWQGMILLFAEQGLAQQDGPQLYLKEATLPIGSYASRPRVVSLSDMPTPDNVLQFWKNMGSFWTKELVDFPALLQTEKAMLEAARVHVLLMMAREYAHYIDRTIPTRTITPGNYFWRASRLSMAILRHIYPPKRHKPPFTTHLQLARTWLHQVKEYAPAPIHADIDPDSLAAQHRIDFHPRDPHSVLALTAYQLSMDLFWWQADSGQTLAAVIAALGMGAQSSLPLYHGTVTVDSGASIPHYLPGSTDGNQGPRAYDTRTCMTPEGTYLLASLDDIRPAGSPSTDGTKVIRLSKLDPKGQLIPLGDVPIPNWKVTTPGKIADLVSISSQEIAIILEKGTAPNRTWRLHRIDLQGLIADQPQDMGHWYHTQTQDTTASPVKLLASPGGQLAFLRITPTPQGGADFGLYLLSKDGLGQQTQRFSSVPGKGWFWALDYALDDHHRIWIADDARGRLLLADGGIIYVAASREHPTVQGPPLWNLGGLGWSNSGHLLLADEVRILKPDGEVKLLPILRQVHIH